MLRLHTYFFFINDQNVLIWYSIGIWFRIILWSYHSDIFCYYFLSDLFCQVYACTIYRFLGYSFNLSLYWKVDSDIFVHQRFLSSIYRTLRSLQIALTLNNLVHNYSQINCTVCTGFRPSIIILSFKNNTGTIYRNNIIFNQIDISFED